MYLLFTVPALSARLTTDISRGKRGDDVRGNLRRFIRDRSSTNEDPGLCFQYIIFIPFFLLDFFVKEWEKR